MRKKLRSLCFAYLAMASILSAPIHPCTSFADYSREPVYGLNFDSLDYDIRFRFYEGHGFGLLAFEFYQDGQWLRMAHFTTDGLHTAGLLLYPPLSVVRAQSDSDVNIIETGSWIYELRSIEAILARVNQVRLHEDGVRSHHVFLGPREAFVCEATKDGNYVERSEAGGYLVTTNFELHKFRGQGPEKVYGVGDSRYRVATRLIESARAAGTMDGDEGMRILRGAAAEAGDFKTRCSMVFMPETLSLKVVFARNFDREYVISLKDRTVTANWPEAQGKFAKIGKGGVYKADLLSWENDDPSDDWKGERWVETALPVLAAIAACAALALAAIWARRRRGDAHGRVRS